MMVKFLALFKRKPFLCFFYLGLGFVVVTVLFIQLLLLPHLLPGLHAGHGLLVGGDWIGFHQLAVAQAENINRFGWKQWQLRPAGHAPAGIASIFYVFVAPEPWALIPLNAALHALSALLLARMIWLFTGHVGLSLVAAAPFLLYPSAATWYAQLHKDGFYITGFFLCLYSWMQLSRCMLDEMRIRFVGKCILGIVLGALLMGIVRDYGVKLTVAMGFLFALAISGKLLSTCRWRPIWQTVSAIFVLFFIPAVTNLLSTNHYFDAAQITAPNYGVQRDGMDSIQSMPMSISWRAAPYLPSRIDAQFFAISQLRRGHFTTYPGAKSNIDPGVRFNSVGDFMAYVPRALQIGLFSPFPSDWVAEGSIQANTVMRRMTALEMLGVYLGLAFVPFALWCWRRRIEMWMFFLVNLMFVSLYAYVVPNIGTLYRMRYGFLMALVALGVAGMCRVIGVLRERRSITSTVSQ